MIVQSYLTASPRPRQQPIMSKRSHDPVNNWPSNLADLEILRQRTAMSVRNADGWLMEHDSLGCILERAFSKRR